MQSFRGSCDCVGMACCVLYPHGLFLFCPCPFLHLLHHVETCTAFAKFFRFSDAVQPNANVPALLGSSCCPILRQGHLQKTRGGHPPNNKKAHFPVITRTQFIRIFAIGAATGMVIGITLF